MIVSREEPAKGAEWQSDMVKLAFVEQTNERSESNRAALPYKYGNDWYVMFRSWMDLYAGGLYDSPHPQKKMVGR